MQPSMGGSVVAASQEHVEDARSDQTRDADAGEHLVGCERDEDESDDGADAAEDQCPGLVMVPHPEIKPAECDGQEHEQQRNQNHVIDYETEPNGGKDRHQRREAQAAERSEERPAHAELVQMARPRAAFLTPFFIDRHASPQSSQRFGAASLVLGRGKCEGLI